MANKEFHDFARVTSLDDLTVIPVQIPDGTNFLTRVIEWGAQKALLNIELAGTPDYLTLSGQVITLEQIDLTADVQNTLPIGNGGTGQTTAQAGFEALAVGGGEIGGDVFIDGNVGIGKPSYTPLSVYGNSIIIERDTNNPYAPTFIGQKKYNGGVVFSGVYTFQLSGYGYSGSSYLQNGFVAIVVDGGVSSSSIPGRIELATTEHGSTAPVVRVTVKNNGNVGIGTTSPTAKLGVVGTSDEVQMEVRANATQTADINILAANSGGAKKDYIDASYNLHLVAGFGMAGVTPAAQQAHITDANGTLADITTKFNTLLADLERFGFLATS